MMMSKENMFSKKMIRETLLVLFIAATFFFHRLQPPLLMLMGVLLIFDHPTRKEIFERLSLRNPSVWFLMFLLLHIIGIAYSTDKAFGWEDIVMKLSFLAFPIYIFFVPVFNKRKTMTLFALFGTLTTLICMITALYRYLSAGYNVLLYEDEFTLYMHRSYQATYWSIGALWAFYHFGRFREYRILFLLMSIVLAAGVILTFSKAGIITLIMGLGIIMLMFLIKYKRYKLFGIALLTTMAFLFLLNYITPKPLARLQAMVNTVLSNEEATNQNDSNGARILMWETSMEVIAEHPVFGVGTGDIKHALRARNTEKGYDELVKVDLNSHNQFLNTGVALGIVGMLILLIIFYTTMVYGIIPDVDKWMVILLTLVILIFALTESVFETQAGVVCFTFMMCMFGMPESNKVDA